MIIAKTVQRDHRCRASLMRCIKCDVGIVVARPVALRIGGLAQSLSLISCLRRQRTLSSRVQLQGRRLSNAGGRD